MEGPVTQKLKLMADYFSWPLWRLGEGDVDPATLPISAVLQDRLKAWADAYNAILNQDDPASSRFPSPEAERAWDEQGLALWRDLQHELGGDYTVTYFSDAQRRELFPQEEDSPST